MQRIRERQQQLLGLVVGLISLGTACADLLSRLMYRKYFGDGGGGTVHNHGDIHNHADIHNHFISLGNGTAAGGELWELQSLLAAAAAANRTAQVFLAPTHLEA